MTAARAETLVGLPSGWRVEIDVGNLLPQGAYFMIELDAQTCACTWCRQHIGALR